jgi:hypothetical protein
VKVRRTKPYVCVDCDFADHHRFQATADVDAAAGTWLRCLAYSRAQEQDGVVKLAWLRRTFASTYGRVEELIDVGLLRLRDDGDYELHAYSPRNQTHAMIEEERASARDRMSARRSALAEPRPAVTPNKRRTNAERSANERRTIPNTIPTRADGDLATSGSETPDDGASSHEGEASATLAPSELPSVMAASSPENANPDGSFGAEVGAPSARSSELVRANNDVTNGEPSPNERRTIALVPISTSTSLSCFSSDLVSLEALSSGDVRAVPRAPAPAPAREDRPPLPPSERAFSGPFWLEAFSEGIARQTGRPCTVGRMYLGTLERIVAHHAPRRDAPNATAWLREQAKAFAAQWDGKHPAKGLTPDGLERWLNEGRNAPPVFGRARFVQPSAEQWHEDDWSDLGAKVTS